MGDQGATGIVSVLRGARVRHDLAMVGQIKTMRKMLPARDIRRNASSVYDAGPISFGTVAWNLLPRRLSRPQEGPGTLPGRWGDERLRGDISYHQRSRDSEPRPRSTKCQPER